MKAIVVDAKSDTPWMLRHESALSLNDLEFSLVVCPSYAAPTEFINRWRMLFRECFWTAELQDAALLRDVVHPGTSTSVTDIVHRLRQRDKSTAGKAAADRLESISLAYPTLFESTTNRWDALHETSLYCPIAGTLTPAARFVTWLLIIERFAYLQHRQHRDQVHTVVFLDEAQTSLSKRAHTISGLPTTPIQLLPTTREHGMQFVIATPSWTELDPLVLSQFQLQIALQPSDGRELDAISKTFRLTPAQARFTGGMPRGTGVGKIRGLEQAFLFTYPAFDGTKDIDDQTREAARARAEKFNSIPSNTGTAAAREENTGWTPPSTLATATASREQPTRATKSTPANVSAVHVISPELSPNSCQETSPNAREEVIPSNAGDRLVEDAGIASNSRERRTSPNALRPRVALNQHVTALLQDVGDHPFTLCTPACRRCGLLLAQGDRTRAQLERLRFLCATRVTCGRGRGKTGIALSHTEEGWRWLGRTPTKGLRGGSSVQHSFCAFELHRRIPGSAIEERLDSKSVDLAVPLNTEMHEPFYRAITLLTGKAPHLENGDIVAVEVEISGGVRSALRNARKDAAAGVALTILAIDDRQPERLALELPPNAIVLDVFALMDALRPTEAR